MNPGWIDEWVGSAQSDYPAIRVVLEITPETTDRTELVAAMREIAEQWEERGWKAFNLEQSGVHSGLVRATSLAGILPEEDHVAAIRMFFLDSLEHVEEMRAEYPHLPWSTTS